MLPHGARRGKSPAGSPGDAHLRTIHDAHEQIPSPSSRLRQAFALNAVLFAAGVIGFLILLKNARREGTLLQGGD